MAEEIYCDKGAPKHPREAKPEEIMKTNTETGEAIRQIEQLIKALEAKPEEIMKTNTKTEKAIRQIEQLIKALKAGGHGTSSEIPTVCWCPCHEKEDT
jgi:septal ring factor EnvC (AmiA/AmiB activator)